MVLVSVMIEDDPDPSVHDFHYLHHRGQDDTQHHDTHIRDTQLRMTIAKAQK